MGIRKTSKKQKKTTSKRSKKNIIPGGAPWSMPVLFTKLPVLKVYKKLSAAELSKLLEEIDKKTPALLIPFFPIESDQLATFRNYDDAMIDALINTLTKKVDASKSTDPTNSELLGTIIRNLSTVKTEHVLLMANKEKADKLNQELLLQQAAKINTSELMKGEKSDIIKQHEKDEEYNFIKEFYTYKGIEPPDRATYENEVNSDFRNEVQELITEDYALEFNIDPESYENSITYRVDINKKILEKIIEANTIKSNNDLENMSTELMTNGVIQAKIDIAKYNTEPLYKADVDSTYNNFKRNAENKIKAVTLVNEINMLNNKLTGAPEQTSSYWGATNYFSMGNPVVNPNDEIVDENQFVDASKSDVYVKILTRKRDKLQAKVNSMNAATLPVTPEPVPVPVPAPVPVPVPVPVPAPVPAPVPSPVPVPAPVETPMVETAPIQQTALLGGSKRKYNYFKRKRITHKLGGNRGFPPLPSSLPL